jgi:hypothetical protein
LFRHRTGPNPEPASAEPEPVAAQPEEPEPVAAQPEPVAPEPEPEPVAEESPPEPAPLDEPPVTDDAEAALDPNRARVILDEALDTLGAAHHRPFSRG